MKSILVALLVCGLSVPALAQVSSTASASGNTAASCVNATGGGVGDEDLYAPPDGTTLAVGSGSSTCSSDKGGVATGSAGSSAKAEKHNVLGVSANAGTSGYWIDLGEPSPYLDYVAGSASAGGRAFASTSDELYFPNGGTWVASGHITAVLSTDGDCTWPQFIGSLSVGPYSVSVSRDQCTGGSVSIAIGDHIPPFTISPGATLQMNASMFAGATAITSASPDGAPGRSTTVDAMHTLEFYLTPSTPGATVVSASGTNYLPPTEPEPEPEYRFTGFFEPVENRPVINVVKSGAAVPIKFSLGGNRGLEILAPGFPGSQRVECEAGADLDPVTQTATPGANALSYDATTDQYTYVWKTDQAWRGTCRAFILKLSNGETHMATFMLRK